MRVHFLCHFPFCWWVQVLLVVMVLAVVVVVVAVVVLSPGVRRVKSVTYGILSISLHPIEYTMMKQKISLHPSIHSRCGSLCEFALLALQHGGDQPERAARSTPQAGPIRPKRKGNRLFVLSPGWKKSFLP